MSVRGVVRRMVVAGLASFGVLLVCGAGSAIAFNGYADTPSIVFGTSGSGEGQFTHPAGVAVNDASGDVYVADQGDNRVERFTTKGQYLSQFNGSDNPAFPEGLSLAGSIGKLPTQIAVDNSNGPSKGDVYVIDSGHNVIDKFTAEGKFVYEIGGFTAAVKGIAVDQSGQLWTLEEVEEFAGAKTVREFSSAEENKLIKTSKPLEIGTEYGPFGNVGPGLAVDSKGILYFLAQPYTKGIEVAKWNPATEEYTETHSGGGNFGNVLAIAPATNNLFVDYSDALTEYGSFGEPNESVLAEFGESISGSDGIAVAPNSTVYATSAAADAVDVFDYGQLPRPSTGNASGLRGSVKLEGTVNPEGNEVTSCTFEYGTTSALGQVAECSALPGSGSSPVAVSAQLSGLELGTTYYYRLTASDSLGAIRGEGKSFTTTGPVPELKTEEATGVELSGESIVATLHGSLAPDGVDTHYYFEYGETPAYGSKTPTLDAGEASEVKPVSASVTGLEPNTTYHYRLAAENTFGVALGGEEIFTTEAILPVLAPPLPVSGITRVTATITAGINPEKSGTTWRVLYGETSAYGEHTPELGVGRGLGEQPVRLGLEGLRPDTTYHYAVQATNQAGTVTGPDEAFTTGAPTPPGAVTGGASNITLTTATVAGTIEAQGLPTSFVLEFGTGIEYGTSIPGEAGFSAEPLQIAVPLQYLAPGTTYHYRFVAVNSDGRTYGADQTFTTPVYSHPIVLPSTLPLIATPAIAFPTETVPTQKVVKKKTSKKKKHKKGKGHAKSKRKRKGKRG